MKTCAQPDCDQIINDGSYCDNHRKTLQNKNRRNYKREDYGPHWDKTRAEQLTREPRCRRCGKPATIADHITPLRWFKSWRQANQPSNLQSLCKPCHDHKTATEDSAFGRNQ